MASSKTLFRNKVILVTGATGTVGQALVQRLLSFRPAAIRIYSRDESRQFEMAQRYAKVKSLRFLIGDVRDRERLERAFENVDIVFHLAALKHVGACEYNPFEAVKTNIQGTQNVLDSAIQNKVDRVLFTSSDKAVNPSNAMGASKLMAERLVTAANVYKGKRRTRFSSVRLGNVLGSRGSIIPLIIDQLNRNERVTLTDPNMTRFVVTLDDIVSFLLECTCQMRGGEIYVPDMPTLATPDLLQAICNLWAQLTKAKKKPGKPRVIGARPGEKNYEELITEEESQRTWQVKSHYVVEALIADAMDTLKPIGRQYRKVADGAISSEDSKHLTLPKIEALIKPYVKALL